MKLRSLYCGVLCIVAGFSLAVPAPACAADAMAPHAGEPTLTLEEALSRTLRNGPELIAAAEDLRAAEAEVVLAGRLPDPELSIVVENVAGSGAYHGSDAAELTIELSQTFELGGKRRLRRDAAELGRQLAVNARVLAGADAFAVVRQRFIAVLAAQERLVLAREEAEMTAKTLAAADERIKAGKAPAADRPRLQGEASLAALAVVRAERTLQTARQALAASWGEVQPDFARVAGELAALPALPPLDEVEAQAEQSVEAANRRLTTELRGNELAQARAGRISDPSLTVGWRQFEESDEHALLFGVSVPLPLFSRGAAAVASADSRYRSARAREAGELSRARLALHAAWQELADSRAAAEVLGSQVVPAAADSFAAAEFGYAAGKFGLLELLDAQRTLFEARQRQLEARTDCHLAAIELQWLLGAEPGAATR
jgi:cobalt-zinc-cadmium efflux system outer membrane protein